MHSSISSSRSRAPKGRELLILLAGTLIGIGMLGTLEWRLRDAGFIPNVQDSKELWASQRARATQLGSKAILLVGDSRIQLNIDLDALRDTTGLEPVQLAIDGSAFLPILSDLAEDPDITGTILVGTTAQKLTPPSAHDRSHKWLEYYDKEFRGLFSPAIEMRLKSLLSEHSSLYSSSIPIELLPSILSGQRRARPDYLRTRHNRQRDADYNLVKMPNFYISRVIRHFGRQINIPPFRSMNDFNRYFDALIKSSPQHNPVKFQKELDSILAIIEKIKNKGANIIFLRMPTDKLVWAIDEHRYPRKKFWDIFAEQSQAQTIHFMDYMELNNIQLPDGSHMDKRDKKRFTENVGRILNRIGISK